MGAQTAGNENAGAFLLGDSWPQTQNRAFDFLGSQMVAPDMSVGKIVKTFGPRIMCAASPSFLRIGPPDH